MITWDFKFETILWWHQVIVHPDNKSIKVFKNGISQGLNTKIPFGGQIEPISTEGLRLLWKNAQKNAKKNKISEMINNKIPYLKPCWTNPVWWPSKVDSRTTSLHQTNIILIKEINPKINTKLPIWKVWKYNTAPFTVIKAEIEAKKGHGLGSTKWYGCFWNKFIFKKI